MCILNKDLQSWNPRFFRVKRISQVCTLHFSLKFKTPYLAAEPGLQDRSSDF